MPNKIELDLELVKKLKSERLTQKQISEILNVSTRKITSFYKEHNLSKNKLENKSNFVDNDYFIDICNSSRNMKEASIKLGLPFSTFKRKAEKIGCYKQINGGWEKGTNFLLDDRIYHKYNLLEFFCENSKVSRSSVKKMILYLDLLNYECEHCKIEKWDNKPISLHLDHINGIRNDNRIENLRFLCPNCHSQTETYCSYNRINSKNIESFTIEELVNIIEKCTSYNQIFTHLGLLYTKSNIEKIQIIIKKNNLNFIIKEKNLDEPIQNLCKCGKHILKNSKRCDDCYAIEQRKVERPPLEQLLKEVEESGYSAVGRKYRVSDNAVRNWIKQYEKNNV